MEIVKVKFRHWKENVILTRVGAMVHNNPASDRIILKLDDGSHEDIIRSTIEEIQKCPVKEK